MTEKKKVWKKTTQALIDKFYDALPNHPDVERRKMFGCPCAFVNQNMFIGLHEENMIVRLPEDLRQKMIDEGASHFQPFPGRVMREYIAVPKEILNKPDALADLVLLSLKYAQTLPAKKKKVKKAT